MEMEYGARDCWYRLVVLVSVCKSILPLMVTCCVWGVRPLEVFIAPA